MSTLFSIGQMNQLADALEAAGYDLSLVTAMRSQVGQLKQFRVVLAGQAQIVPKQHFINCDADPFLPDSWSVHEENQLPRRIRGTLEWNPAKVALWLSDEQSRGAVIGEELKKELASQAVLPANVLDYLLANPHLIPEEWKGKYVFFWGTVYRNRFGDLFVRCLFWVGDRWVWRCGRLGSLWRGYDPALVLAS